ncbi:IclR family transcriptional regulator [Glaciibacter sp. 2TAF33]|uniref:IclR family transcriptional regulator n=1 Tax=Glaciibacter sp. 2TAF33 TaxID=3233015 RepID=UPI003F93468E
MSGPANSGDERSGKVQATGSASSSADRIIELLLELVATESVRVSDAARLLGVSRPTAHRLLTTLVRHGVITQDYSGGPYSTSLRFATLASRSSRSFLLELARQQTLALRDDTGETTHFAVLQGNSCRFVTGFEGFHSRSTPLRVGMVLPAHATAPGKAILGAVTPEVLHNLYPRGVQTLTDATLGSMDEIDGHLQEVARRGYATNFSESEVGLTAVAVVVRDSTGSPVGALAISGPRDRLPSERIPPLAARMQRAALAIQSALAGSPA